jgi:putative protease
MPGTCKPSIVMNTAIKGGRPAPELLLPAGSPDKVRTAVAYGADAVYMGGRDYSLRARAGNMDAAELAAAISFLHAQHRKAYITVNIFVRNADLADLPAYLALLQELQADGVIFSDPAILRLARAQSPALPLILSTQANTLNYEAALFYRDLGVQRIVLGRELSLTEIRDLKEKTGLEIEVFVHGAMCVSYSGRCLLSQYLTGRDANRGACAQPCRYRYLLREEQRPGAPYTLEEDERGAYVMNSADLCLLPNLPELIDAGVDSFKVEGRMKNQLYIASVGSVYRAAIDTYRTSPAAFAAHFTAWQAELDATATRPFTTGFLNGTAPDMPDMDKAPLPPGYSFAGLVTGYDPQLRRLRVEQRSLFAVGDNLEFFLPGLVRRPFRLDELWTEAGLPADRACHPREHLFLPWPEALPSGTILRARHS